MINYKIVYKIIGSLLFIEAALMSGSLLVSLIYKEDDIFASSSPSSSRLSSVS